LPAVITEIETSPLRLVSIVVPLYNEAENVRELCTLTWRVLGTVEDIDYEIILLDGLYQQD